MASDHDIYTCQCDKCEEKYKQRVTSSNKRKSGKPRKPTLQITGLATLNDYFKKVSTVNHQMEGGVCPVVDIDQAIELLKEIKEEHHKENPVIISSKRSLYVGKFKIEQYKKECERYEEQMKEYKVKRKASLLKQLEALDNE